MATASKEENSTRKAQALYVTWYQSFALLIIPFKTARASGFFSRKNRMLSQANLGLSLISGSTKKDCIFQWMRSFLTNSLNSWLAKHIVISQEPEYT